MAIHHHFYEILFNLINAGRVKKIALLGDQLAINARFEFTPFVEYYDPNIRNTWYILEHPCYQDRLNNNAEYIHLDLNLINSKNLPKFDLVIDGGTLEHVFNFPLALTEIWKSISVGGNLVGSYPINNLVDHGYWMPQPRLFRDFFRINGGDLESELFFSHEVNSIGVPIFEFFSYPMRDPETMTQDESIKTSHTSGYFFIAAKKNNKDLIYPTEFD